MISFHYNRSSPTEDVHFLTHELFSQPVEHLAMLRECEAQSLKLRDVKPVLKRAGQVARKVVVGPIPCVVGGKVRHKGAQRFLKHAADFAGVLYK